MKITRRILSLVLIHLVARERATQPDSDPTQPTFTKLRSRRLAQSREEPAYKRRNVCHARRQAGPARHTRSLALPGFSKTIIRRILDFARHRMGIPPFQTGIDADDGSIQKNEDVSQPKWLRFTPGGEERKRQEAGCVIMDTRAVSEVLTRSLICTATDLVHRPAR